MTPQPARLTVAIPLIGPAESAALQRTLDAWLELSLLDHIEILVQVGSAHSDEFDPVLMSHPAHPLWDFAADTGVYDAMNKMIQRATAPRILFLGAGDLPLPGLSNAIQRWTADPVNIELGGVRIDSPEQRVPVHYPARWDRSLIWRNTTHHQGMAYPLALIRAWGGFSEHYRVLGDYALNIDLFQAEVQAQWEVGEDWVRVQAGGLSRQFNMALYREEWALKKERLPLGWARCVQPLWLIGKALWKMTAQRGK